jgi:hypothetical protein
MCPMPNKLIHSSILLAGILIIRFMADFYFSSFGISYFTFCVYLLAPIGWGYWVGLSYRRNNSGVAKTSERTITEG